jgi:cell division protein FtsQ
MLKIEKELLSLGGGAVSRYVFLFVTLLVVAAVLTFVTSAYFAVSEVVFVGNKYFIPDELLLMTGIKKGTNLFQVNSKKVIAELKSHPRIWDASVQKIYPSKLKITIWEREAVAVLPMGESFLELSDDGFIIAVSDRVMDTSLPIITGSNPVYAKDGMSLKSKGLELALFIACNLDKHVAEQISEISVAILDNIRLYTNDGITVYFGDETNLKEKIAIFETFLSEYAQKRSKVVSVDLRIEGKMVVKEK